MMKRLTVDMNRRLDGLTLMIWVLVLLLAASAIAVRVSIMTGTVRALLVASVIFTILTCAAFLAKRVARYPMLVYPIVVFIAFLIVWAIRANKPYNVDYLRSSYAGRLMAFEGTRYVWGGETNNGIDCSGLARTAMWQAMLKQGLLQLNSRLLIFDFWKFWWHDMSASDIYYGRYGYTRKIGHADKLAGYKTSKLKQGDMAIAGDGVHVLIYLGHGRWIEANPDDKKVVINTAPKTSRRGWFNTPVTFVRWKALDNPGPEGIATPE